MNVNITSTKVEFLSKGTSIVFRGDDLLRGQVIQNPAGQGSIVRLTLSKEARDVTGSDFYDISPLGIDNQPTWTNRWEQTGVFTCLDDLTPLFRKCCEGGGGGGGTVDTIVAGDGIDVDSTDPANPEVSARVDGTTIGFNGSGELEVIGGAGAAITSLTTDVVATGPGPAAATIQPNVVSNTKLADMAQATLKGRASGAGTGDPTDLTPNQASTILDGATDPFVRTSALPGAGIDELTGDVTAGPGSGSQASTIANGVVTYAKMQNVSATDKLLGRSTAGAGVVEEIPCTAAGRALLDDATAADQRTTLGLGTSATANTGTGASDVPTITDADGRYLQISDAFTLIKKTSSTSRNNNTLASDPDLLFPMAANTSYTFTITVYVQASAAGDFKSRVTGPAAPTSVFLSQTGFGTTGMTLSNRIAQAYDSTDLVQTHSSNFVMRWIINGTVNNGVNAGDLVFQWAQNTTAAGNPTLVLAGSTLEWAEL